MELVVDGSHSLIAVVFAVFIDQIHFHLLTLLVA